MVEHNDESLSFV
ncbi:unnamed protein product, partial [Rotaria sp. Silwood2]